MCLPELTQHPRYRSEASPAQRDTENGNESLVSAAWERSNSLLGQEDAQQVSANVRVLPVVEQVCLRDTR